MRCAVAQSDLQLIDRLDRMPVFFVGHGSPLNAVEDNEFSRAWTEMARPLSTPEAILCISAHWETDSCQVTAMERPRTIYDFYGFPAELYEVTYPAPGAPQLALLVQELVRSQQVRLDYAWGLDHGAWSVLSRFYPQAQIPVVQLSLDRNLSAQAHYDLGRELRPLRHKGVLVMGSGNIVHNLQLVTWQDTAYDWAHEFNDTLRRLILARDHQAIIDYRELDQAGLAVPTPEHFLPLLYALAMQEDGDAISFFAEKLTLGAISMRSLRIG